MTPAHLLTKNTKVYFSPYQLKFYNKFKEPLEGALMLFEFNSNVCGYSDFLPWPQRGEVALSQQLHNISLGKYSSRFLISAQNAYDDACFRIQKCNPFYGLKLPPSHFFIEDILSFNEEDIILKWDYKYIKVKLNQSLLKKQLEKIKQITLNLPSFVKWRLDGQGQNLKFPKEFLSSMKNSIDFIEDPQGGFSFQSAEDWISQKRTSIKVIKPSRDSLKSLNQGIAFSRWKRFVFTHSFDHPLGQVITAFRAAQFYQNHPLFFETCGLKCLSLQNDKYLLSRSASPFFQPPHGFGFGWQEELQREKWKKLK